MHELSHLARKFQNIHIYKWNELSDKNNYSPKSLLFNISNISERYMNVQDFLIFLCFQVSRKVMGDIIQV